MVVVGGSCSRCRWLLRHTQSRRSREYRKHNYCTTESAPRWHLYEMTYTLSLSFNSLSHSFNSLSLSLSFLTYNSLYSSTWWYTNNPSLIIIIIIPTRFFILYRKDRTFIRTIYTGGWLFYLNNCICIEGRCLSQLYHQLPVNFFCFILTKITLFLISIRRGYRKL